MRWVRLSRLLVFLLPLRFANLADERARGGEWFCPPWAGYELGVYQIPDEKWTTPFHVSFIILLHAAGDLRR